MTRPATAMGERWCLEIATGPNAGAAVPLAAGQYRLGADRDNDIVLADSAVAGQQAVLTVDLDSATLDALATGAQWRGSPLPAGSCNTLYSGAEILVGATTLRLHGPRSGRRSRLLSVAVPTALLALAALLPTGISEGPGVAHRSADPPRPAVAVQPARALPPPVRHAVASPAPTAPEAAGALQDHLLSMGLAGTIATSVAGNALVATGGVAPSARDRWVAAQMWFDGRFGGRITLIDRVGASVADTAPRFQVRAVSAGVVPYVITVSGERYTEGAVLDGGWVIAQISAERIVLHNGDRRLEVGL